MNKLDKSIGKFQRRLNLKPRTGYLGDGSGEVRDRSTPGRYLVRFLQAEGSYSTAVSLPTIANANLPMTEGTPVEVGYDSAGNSVILGVNLIALTATGDNALHLNPLDNQSDGFVPQDKITTFYATRHADSDNFPFYASVFPGLYFDDSGDLQLFAGDNVDLASFQPASGEHCYAVVLLKTDGTLEAFASTPIDSGDALSFADIQEALTSASDGSTEIRAWQIDGDDTLLTVDETKIVDIRLLFSNPTQGDPHLQYITTTPSTDIRNVIQPTADTVKALVVKAFSPTQSDNLQEWQNSTGTALMTVGPDGLVGIGGAPVSAKRLTIYPLADATTPLQIRQNSSTQSANLTEWTTNSGTVVSFVDANARVGIGVTSFAFRSGLEVNRVWTTTADTHIAIRGIGQIAPTGASTGNYYGFNGGVIIGSGDTFGTSGLLIGMFPSVDIDGSGTITNARTLQAQTNIRGSKLIATGVGLYSLLSLLGTGSATTYTHLYIAPFSNSGTGTVGTYRGIYIEDIAAGTSNNYAIVTNAGQVVINEGGSAISHFRVEGDTDASLLRTDAALDRVAIGGAPSINDKLLVSVTYTDAAQTSRGANISVVATTTASQTRVHQGLASGLTIITASGQTLSGTQTALSGATTIFGTHAGTTSTINQALSTLTVNTNAAGSLGTVTGVNFAYTWNTNTLAITSLIGVNIPAISSGAVGGATITTLTGIEIGDQTAGGTNFSIRTRAGAVVFNNDGNANSNFSVETDTVGQGIYTVASTERFGVGINAPTTKAHVLLTDTTTNAVANVLTIGHRGGTVTHGFGSGLIFELESDTTNDLNTARITAHYVVATHASRTGRMTFYVSDANGEREAIRMEASGTAPMLGFFGANAVVKPTALTGALTQITHTAPGTPDYAIQNLTNVGPYGFVTQDEGNTVLSVIKNLQVRVDELEAKQQTLGLLT